MSENTRLSTTDAASYLGFSANTLRCSRVTGMLASVSAPRYKKMGRRVFYEMDTLDEWLEQVGEQSNTAHD